jgi:cardiolipin synthase A/B
MSLWFPRFTLHSLAVVVSVLTYVLTTRVERDRRPPSIAIAWVLGMITLPYLVLPMYFMFGRRKLPRKSVRPRSPQPQGRHWAEDLIESFDLPPAAPAAIRMHRNGDESSQALFQTIDGALHQLDVCTYIFGDDEFGREAARHLCARARAGVQVRLLIDGVGALQLPRANVAELQHAGVQTAIFSPLFARRTQGPRNLRNHRKLVIADGRRLWAGGRNIAAEYFAGLNGAPPWIDLSFDLRGAAALAAAAQFEQDWVAAGGKPFDAEMLDRALADIAAPLAAHLSAAEALEEAAAAAHQTAPQPPPSMPASRSVAQFLPSGPDQTEDTVHALLIDACFQARQRILATTPYFVPDVSLEAALRLAARRGVRIDLYIPARSNHRLADFVRNRSLRALAQAGVHVHLLPYMSHAKAILFDDSLALSGSVNLDSRSLLLNYESAVVFYGAAEINWLAEWIGALETQALPYDARPPNLWRDLCEGLLLTVAYQL